MNELISVFKENGKELVSARELHSKLGVTERFQKWFGKRVKKYGFVKGEDYTGCKIFHTLAKQKLQDYAITTTMAKELCLVQDNEIGRKIRS